MNYDLIFVDCEAPFGKGSPAVADMTEFAAIHYPSRLIFRGTGCSLEVFNDFKLWLAQFERPVFISDNVAYDWQWINFYFWKYFQCNPFGHSGRRISDYYAGLCGNFYKTQGWKRLRITKHTHNPVDDAMGNLEAFVRLQKGDR